jgi:2-polyprenyl-6-methoxyphenol hydroxylase-like FAD-dependent oxidoreductase
MGLNIIIAGAGLAGCTTAIALQSSGHNVTLYERRDALYDNTSTHSGIQIQPNGVAILKRLGMIEAVDAVSHDNFYTDFRDYQTGETIALVNYNRRGGTRWGARQKLKDAIVGEARRRGVPVHIGVGVVGVRESKESVTVELSDGSTQTADLLVGADGTWSRVRKGMFPDFQPNVLDAVICQVQVPGGVIDEEPHKGFMNRAKGAISAWPSPGRSALTSVSPHTGLFELQAIDSTWTLESDAEPEKRLGWCDDIERIRDRWSDHPPAFRALLDKAERYYKWRLVEVAKIPAWSSAKVEGRYGRTLLVGDAGK